MWVESSLLCELYLGDFFVLVMRYFLKEHQKLWKLYTQPMRLCFLYTLISPPLTLMPDLWFPGVLLLWQYIRGSGGGSGSGCGSRGPAGPGHRWHRHRGDQLPEEVRRGALRRCCHLLPGPFSRLQLLDTTKTLRVMFTAHQTLGLSDHDNEEGPNLHRASYWLLALLTKIITVSVLLFSWVLHVYKNCGSNSQDFCWMWIYVVDIKLHFILIYYFKAALGSILFYFILFFCGAYWWVPTFCVHSLLFL